MIARDRGNSDTSLLSLPPTRRQTRLVVAVAVCQVAALALITPFAKIRLGPINGFFPAFDGMILVSDLVTSVLLFSQFAIYRLRAVLVLACGYLFSALIIIPLALSFPGTFFRTGLPGASVQTTAYLYNFWNLLFPLALLGYGLMRDEKPEPGPAQRSSLATIVGSVALVLVLVCGLTLLATAGSDYLPALFADSVIRRRTAPARGAVMILVCVSALVVLWRRRRSLLDQWLMIVALTAIMEIYLSIFLISDRFTLGSYAGRLFLLLTSTIVLVVLLAETTWLYARVAHSNEGKIRRLVDANILGICIWNLDDAIVGTNDEFLRMLQYEREDVASGRLHWTELTAAEWRERDKHAIAELRSKGTFQPFETEYLRQDGSRVPVLIGGALFAEGGSEGVAFVLDLTERKRAEQAVRELESEFAHMNRVSMIGELAASLSHEILHPIATARNNARAGMRFLEMNPPNLDETKEALRCVVRDADRAKDIVGRVRDHIRKAPPRKEPFDLKDAVGEALIMVRGAIARNVTKVNTYLMDEPALVQGDRVQLQQVVVNLILNAAEAMSLEEEGARELSIRVEQGHADSGVLVQVRDSGPGIDPGYLDRVFEPFYTTKTSGIGMGLSICRSIINAHGGRLWAESNEPCGAIFQFTLPPA